MSQSQSQAQGQGQGTSAQIFLQPIAAPAILGLFGIAGALWVMATHWAGWYGSATSPLYLFPWVAFVGGLAVFLAGMWAYRARDGVATALFGVWGAFFLAFGLINLISALTTRVAPLTTHYVEFGYWLMALAAITWTIAFAAVAENLSLATVCFFLAIGASIFSIGELINTTVLIKIGAWVLLAAAVLAWWAASALMIAMTTGRVMLPFVKTGVGGTQARVQAGYGEPGVVHGI
jgi:succinate-acetate transporter protein